MKGKGKRCRSEVEVNLSKLYCVQNLCAFTDVCVLLMTAGPSLAWPPDHLTRGTLGDGSGNQEQEAAAVISQMIREQPDTDGPDAIDSDWI